MVWNIFHFSILGIIIPTDFHIFQRGRYTTNQVYVYLGYLPKTRVFGVVLTNLASELGQHQQHWIMLDPSLQKSDEESAKEPMPSGVSLMPRIQGADFLGRETQENQEIYIPDFKKKARRIRNKESDFT